MYVRICFSWDFAVGHVLRLIEAKGLSPKSWLKVCKDKWQRKWDSIQILAKIWNIENQYSGSTSKINFKQDSKVKGALLTHM